MTDLTQILPPELLAEVLGYASVLDILRFKQVRTQPFPQTGPLNAELDLQVNRTSHNVVVASTLIQHKIDLYATGMEWNASAGVNVAASQNALRQYRSGLDSLRPIEEEMVTKIQVDHGDNIKAVGGVFAIASNGPVWLFTLGSVSRGIPQRKWKIPVPIACPVDFTFYPGADVIAFVEQAYVHVLVVGIGYYQLTVCNSPLMIVIHLRTLSDGEHHPATERPTILYSHHDGEHSVSFVSITGSRLAVLTRVSTGQYLVIWDWKTGEMMCVCQSFCHDSTNGVQVPV
jgi:hypothetical protein